MADQQRETQGDSGGDFQGYPTTRRTGDDPKETTTEINSVHTILQRMLKPKTIPDTTDGAAKAT